MKKVELSDIKNIYEYEKTRKDFQNRIIELKKHRRVSVGDRITLVFENRDTVIFQIQEMMRAERLVDDKAIQAEIDVYNDLIPDEGELSATLLVEIREKDKIKPYLDSLIGLDKGFVFMRIGEQHSIPAIFEVGHSEDNRISAVQYVRFKLTPEQQEMLCSGKETIQITIDHPNYKHSAVVPDDVLQSLGEDLSA